ncbi:MAG: Xaa-Pro aminopeptidase [Chromatiales bacterium]|jgi:Xaa-Pro aminopeptidase|nr:Xaa-Pro aminopeptidase [Chromatiales bacterium]
MAESSIEVSKQHQNRRRRLMRAMGRNSIAILPTAVISARNNDVEYPFRHNSDFYYLTGFEEPRAVMVLIPGRPEGEFILFCRERDPQMELWNGRRAGLEGAREIYGADVAYPIEALDEYLPALLENRDRIHYTLGSDPDFDRRISWWMKQAKRKSRAGVHVPAELVSLEHLVHEMRLFKDREEAALMRHAAQISAAAHSRAMMVCRPGMMEYQLEAELVHEFMSHGARSVAYSSIVGGGANACVLHYTSNDAMLRDGDLVLIDAGAEYRGYASDITRTFPVNGRFTEAQRELYDLVLEAQLAAIAKVKPGNCWNDPHDTAVRVLTKGMVELGLLKGDVSKLISEGEYRRFYMHRTGHWLGMDVHDVGEYMSGEQWRKLEPGMVLTIEPGIYVAAGSKGVAKRWWNIGIRIEDDVLVTRGGCEVLTRDVPKDADEIEALMASQRAA